MEKNKVFALTGKEIKHHFYNHLSVIRTRLANTECGCGFISLDPKCEFCVFRDDIIGIFDVCLIDLGKNTDWRSKFSRNLMEYSREIKFNDSSEIKFNDILSLRAESHLFFMNLRYVMEDRQEVSFNFWSHYELALERIEQFLDSFKNLPAFMSNLTI